jgi:hypothetical protein
VALSGFDGLLYSIGFLVGWPIVMFLIAEAAQEPRPLHVLRRGRVPAAPDARAQSPAAIGSLAVSAST